MTSTSFHPISRVQRGEKRLDARRAGAGIANRFQAILMVGVLVVAGCSSKPEKTSATSSPRQESVTQSTPHPQSETRVVATGADSLQPQWSSTGAVSSTVRISGDYADYPAVTALIRRMERGQGMDSGDLARIFSRVERQQWILDFLNRSKRKSTGAPTGAWTRYRAKFLTADNVRNGAAFWSRYRSTLDRAYEKYGVPPEYVVAILGVETRWGGYVGKHKVIEALSTLAFDYPRRSEFFTGELEAFLVMCRDEGFNPFKPVGSYAGAMGLGQFMPTSFQRFAVDFDGSGRRDLWNPVDAIGSVANYFKQHGWRTGELVAVRARTGLPVPRSVKTGYKSNYSASALDGMGVRATVPLDGNAEVSLLEFDAKGGYQYWLGLKNFYVITRYNHSSYYAMAVHQLAEAVRQRQRGVAAGT